MTPKERIVEQAMRMFAAQGIKSVRMDDIAQQLGVSKRTLYEQFGDKEGLLYLAMSCYFERDRLRHEEMTRDAGNVLEAMFIVLCDVMATSGTTNRMLDNLRKFYPAVYEKLMSEGTEQSRADFRRMLVTGSEEGLFTDRFDLDLAITVLFYTASGLMARKGGGFVLPGGIDERKAFVQIISTFLRGISTPKGLRLVDDCLKRCGPSCDR